MSTVELRAALKHLSGLANHIQGELFELEQQTHDDALLGLLGRCEDKLTDVARELRQFANCEEQKEKVVSMFERSLCARIGARP